jgi:hypothetical protein
MRNSILLLLTLFTFFAKGQVQQSSALYLNDSTIINKKDGQEIKMPNEFKQSYKLQLLGNNNKGFDIFKSEIDNMLVLKPDENFKDKMTGSLSGNILPLPEQFKLNSINSPIEIGLLKNGVKIIKKDTGEFIITNNDKPIDSLPELENRNKRFDNKNNN